MLRAKHVTMGQVARLEEAWKTDPTATLDTLAQPSADEDPEPVSLKWVCAVSRFLSSTVGVRGRQSRARSGRKRRVCEGGLQSTRHSRMFPCSA